MLVLISGPPGDQQRIGVARRRTLVGSAADADLVLDDLAPRHFELVRSGDAVELVDAGGGVRVGDIFVERRALAEGDVVAAGPRRFRCTFRPDQAFEVVQEDGSRVAPPRLPDPFADEPLPRVAGRVEVVLQPTLLQFQLDLMLRLERESMPIAAQLRRMSAGALLFWRDDEAGCGGLVTSAVGMRWPFLKYPRALAFCRRPARGPGCVGLALARPAPHTGVLTAFMAKPFREDAWSEAQALARALAPAFPAGARAEDRGPDL